MQIFFAERRTGLEEFATEMIRECRGRLDGESENVLVYTVPVSVGFPTLEAAPKKIVARHPTIEWFYGNVYDPVDGTTPLNWWK